SGRYTRTAPRRTTRFVKRISPWRTLATSYPESSAASPAVPSRRPVTRRARLLSAVPAAPGVSHGREPASKFSTSLMRSGPAWDALDPAKKKQPRRFSPLVSVSSASARCFSTRNWDIRRDIGSRGGRLDILSAYGVHKDRQDLVQRQDGRLGRGAGARPGALPPLRDRRVRGYAQLPDGRRPGDL